MSAQGRAVRRVFFVVDVATGCYTGPFCSLEQAQKSVTGVAEEVREYRLVPKKGDKK